MELSEQERVVLRAFKARRLGPGECLHRSTIGHTVLKGHEREAALQSLIEKGLVAGADLPGFFYVTESGMAIGGAERLEFRTEP